MRLTLAARMVRAAADVGSRTITGVATIYGLRADASTGPVTIDAGALEWADDVSRVKLLIDHDQRQPVGFMTAADDGPDKLVTSFYVPESEAGDEALRQAADGRRDGLSVGLWADDVSFENDGSVRVRHAVMREVTLCAIPAYDDARVSDVAASTGRNLHMKCSTCGFPHAAGAPCVVAPQLVAASGQPINSQPAPSSYAEQPAEDEQTPAAGQQTPAAGRQTQTPAGGQRTPAQRTEAAAGQLVAASGYVAAGGQAGAPNPPRRIVTLRQAAELVSRAVQSGQGAAAVRAALADVTPASLPNGTQEDPFLRDSFLGELWTASRVARPFIDVLGTPRDITGLKVYGWKWEVRPEVGTYAGNKAEIPTNSPKIVPAEAAVERIAGGWDVDRIYVDLGDASMIEALWSAAVEDYRLKSEAAVVAKLLAAATDVATPATSLPAALVSIGQTAAGIGANVGAIGVGAGLWGQFAGLTRDDVPWWMGNADTLNIGTTEGSVGGLRFFVDPTLGATQYLAMDPRAATFHEKNPPVRVNAVDLAHGGIDLGLFGYLGLIVNDARAIIKGTVAATV